ncbi:MAG: hypothetical protein M3Q07_03770, partial [Pseudobdellovibrionaceae bacterium]|nr:hypothetical protein [Pseudobdellovibrionaceae bacterium]
AHGMGKANEYNYFYEWKGKNSDEKPKPLPLDHPLNALSERIHQQPPVYFAKIEGQKFHTTVYKTIRTMGYVIRARLDGSLCMADQPDCMASCNQLGAQLDSEYGGLLAGLPYSLPAKDIAQEAYREYEADANACLPLLGASAFEQTVRASLTSMVEDHPIPLPSLAVNASALDLIQAADQGIRQTIGELESAQFQLIQEALDKGLGWYTTEQEADDIGTEMVYRLGLNPMSFVESSIKFAENAGSTECRKQYEAGFPRPIWMGGLDDNHHDYCFRAYNSYREIEAHKEHFARFKDCKTPVVQPEMSWDAALETLDQLDRG